MKKILLSLFCLIAIAANAQTGNLLQNSSFEEWSENLPNGWATLKATNATVEQSSDAHSGSSSVVVKGASNNRRFTSGSYTLEAGTYTISGYFKANGEEAGHYRLGYIKLKDSVVVDSQKDYIYDDTPAQAATSEWKEETFTFTLDTITEIAVNIMNNKNGKGASFLVDDVTLVAGESEGGEDGGEEPEQPTEVSTIAEVLAAGAGDAAVKGTVIATYARGFLVNDGTGTILVYLGSDKGHAEGDVVTVSGETSLYGGLLQFAAGSTVEKSGTASVSHPTPATMTGAQLDEYLESPVIKYVEYTGTLNINGNYYNIAVEGAATAIASIQYPKEGIVNATSGAVVKVTGYTIGASSGKYVNTMAVKVEVIEEGEPEQPTEVSTIADVIASGAGDAAVKGTIIATYARGFLVNDGTGTILVYLGSDKGYAEGDIVTVSGATNIYGGLLQFGTNPTVEKSGTTSVSHPTPTTMTGAQLDEYLDSPVIKYVEYTGTLTINGNYYNVAVEGASTAIGSIQYPKEGVVTVQSGTVVKVTGYTIGASSGKYVNTMAIKVEAEEGDTQPDEPLVGSVSDALAAYVDGKQIQATVTGYIVGAVNGAVETGCEFGSTEVATNILIADNADESDYTKCLIIQLPKGDIRSALNLADNAENYKKQIKISGSLETYFKTAGLKSITEYEFTGVTGIESLENESGEKVIYDLTGLRVDTITKAGIYIVNGKKTLVK
ncbi:MAG: OB-fold nucleic acid binding domain-containing protein [Bacteroidaceae bacterium]|nr:OB-fold nucleic acid binding domain-containing protein [Bacteroidaceae bacterium]